MTIIHHLDEATIIAHAAGTLDEARGFAVATHLSLCPQCRAALRAAERVGGSLLAAGDFAAVSESCRSATLASLDAASPAQRTAPQAPGTSDELPVVLSRLIGHTSLEAIRWKRKGPGIAVHDIPLSQQGRSRLQLLKVGPGRKLPEHGHGGGELTVVLRGSFSDHSGRYGRGDVADLDEDTEHQPVVDSLEECICLIAMEAPTRFKSFWARLAQPFLGI